MDCGVWIQSGPRLLPPALILQREAAVRALHGAQRRRREAVAAAWTKCTAAQAGEGGGYRIVRRVHSSCCLRRTSTEDQQREGAGEQGVGRQGQGPGVCAPSREGAGGSAESRCFPAASGATGRRCGTTWFRVSHSQRPQSARAGETGVGCQDQERGVSAANTDEGGELGEARCFPATRRETE